MTKLMLVTDDAFSRRSLTEDLTSLGYTVLKFSSGQGLVERLKEHVPDLLVFDLDLQSSDNAYGATMTRMNSSIPVVALTRAKGKPSQLPDGIAPDAYVAKASSRLQLQESIASVLNRRATCQNWLIDIGGLRIDQLHRTVTINGKPVSLRRDDFDLLSFIASRPSHEATAQEVAEAIRFIEAVAPRPRSLATRLRTLTEALTNHPARFNPVQRRADGSIKLVAGLSAGMRTSGRALHAVGS